jgi:sulfoxide reductase heme-binding subunit YedZ
MKAPRFTRLQLASHIGAWVPLLSLLIAYLTSNLTVNPIQAAEQRTGQYAIVLLALSLACTPVNTLFRVPAVVKLRRPLGLYAFMYAAIHMAIFVALDFGFDWSLIGATLIEKRYLVAGLGAFTILVALAVTSVRWWMKRLGKNWKRLHRLVYLSGVLVVLHYAWAIKGDLLRLQGDVWKPLAAGMVLALLLILRLPPVRKQLGAAMARLRSGRAPVVGHPRPLA